MITTYTTYAEIRAVLGVDDDELTDTTLALPVYDSYLTMELEEVNIDLPATYATVKAESAPTAPQQRFIQATQMFATFAVAKQLSSSLPLFTVKQQTDSKAGVTRFDNPYKDTIASIAKEYDRLKNRLVQALNAVGSATEVSAKRVFFSTSPATYNPITNAGA